MQKWEYNWELRTRHPIDNTYVTMSAWENDVTGKIAALGEAGWELVAIVPRSSQGDHNLSGVTTEELWVFKRPKA